MRKYIFVLLFVVTALLNADIGILEQTPERIIIQFDIKDFSISEGKDFTFVNIQDWTTEAVLGTPDLPFKTLNVAIPPNGKINIRIISKNIEKQTLYKPLSPVPRIQRGGRTFEYIYEIDAELYAKKISEYVQILEETRYRYYSIIPVRITPFLYDSNTKELTFCDRMTLQINIEGDTSFRNEIQDKFDFIYKDFILNYETSRYWRTKVTKQINKIPFEKSDFWYKFEIELDGLYKLTYDELSQLPSFCEPDSIRILTMYRKIINNDPQNYEFELIEVPAFVDAGNDGSFDKGDNVYFFKENYEDPGLPIYSTQKIYWLTFGGYYENKPLRVEELLNKNLAIPVENFQRKKIIQPPSREDIDAIIIYPEENVFRSQSEELRDIHPELNFELKSQADIFAEFGQGDPFSIKQYLEDQYNDTLNIDLQYVILMGSGTSEWSNPTEKNKIMVYENSDDYFVYFNSVYHPELSIGRLPAKNDNDMDFLIERIRKYIEEPTPGFWKNCVLLIADDENKSGGYEGFGSAAMNHSRNVQETGDVMNDSVYVDKVMGIEYGFDEYQNKPAARNDIIEKINEGRLMWYFVGHGNEDVLGDEDYFRGSLHTNLLDNEEHLPLFIAASCEVGMFDNPYFDCIPERLLLYENGGAIASIAARRGSSPGPNTILMKYFFKNAINEGHNIGFSLLDAKLNSTASDHNSSLYNILGDPIMLITQPERGGAISGIPDSLRAREIISIDGDFGTGNFINDNGEIRVFESEYDITYINNDFVNPDSLVYTVDYTKNGNTFFYGEMQISSGTYNAQFIVPDDIHAGNKGRIINYVFDDIHNKDYISCYYPMKLSGIPIDTTSTSPPQVHLYLDSRTFIEGDYVSTDPLLMAEIEDENGINILGSAGHKILLLLDDTMEPVDVTKGFVYNIGSYTKGELTWQLSDLSEGRHTLQLIVFDNFNTPTVAQTNFISKRSGKVAIEQMLPYPNPMEKGGHFTFVITEDSDITVMIYTITGKKIRTLKEPSCSAGYNQVYWDGKDGDGDKIANNTYFYNVKARQLSNGKTTEKIGKVIILK